VPCRRPRENPLEMEATLQEEQGPESGLRPERARAELKEIPNARCPRKPRMT
jgi:hypothetical protein